MHILDLPSEVLDHILYFSILSRGIPRAFRLKLVCSKSSTPPPQLSLSRSPLINSLECFRTAFNRILFHTGLLDAYASDTLFEHWHTRKYHGADRLWHDYLLFNCRNLNSRGSVRRVGEIRDTARALLRRWESHENEGCRDLDLDTILDKLCWLALEGSTKTSGLVKDKEPPPVGPPPGVGLNLLSAAAFFECETLVRELLAQGHDPVAHDLFPSPMYIAAWTGQAGLLQLMQESLPDFENLEPAPHPEARFRSKIGPGSLEGAAARGDVEIARLALYPPSRTIPQLGAEAIASYGDAGSCAGAALSETLVLDERPGAVAHSSRLGGYISKAMRITGSPEVYEYLKSFLDPDLTTQRMKNMDLAAKATAGDVIMVRRLLETGAEPTPKDTDMRGPPLMYAIRAWHEDVVDLMLEHGADVNERGGFRRGTVLTTAANAGSISLLRKLLDAGAEVDLNKDGFTLWQAILGEHTGMVGLLLRLGVNSERGRRAKVRHARHRGLESMVELLEPWVMGGGPAED